MPSKQNDEKMKEIETMIKKTIDYAKKTKIEHKRFDDVQEPIHCSKCGRIVFRYSTLPFKTVLCPDCSKDRTKTDVSSNVKIFEAESSKMENKETISNKKTFEIIRTETGIKVRKKEIEKDEQE
jgi:RNA polymerase subunit RPABC4/transcription elongation factor Spt4